MEDTSRATEKRYANLDAVSRSLRGYGAVLRVVALVVFLAGAGLGSWLTGWMLSGAIFGAAGGACFGVCIWALGLIVAAFGEALMALADIAKNTGRGNESAAGRDD